jgi:PilZ domain
MEKETIDESTAGLEQRKYQRISLGVPILVPHLQKSCLCLNLSVAGCFLPEINLASLGTKIPLLIDLPGMGKINVAGVVVHTGKEEEGTGLDFVEIDPLGKVYLEKFLEIFLA